MNQSSRNIVAALITVVVLSLLAWGSSELAKRSPEVKGDRSTGTAASQSQTNVAPITYQGQDGKTVLELLQADHDVDVIDSSLGKYVRAINGVSSTENSFWFYYVNDEPGVEAADKVTTQNSQTIEWRYESF